LPAVDAATGVLVRFPPKFSQSEDQELLSAQDRNGTGRAK